MAGIITVQLEPGKGLGVQLGDSEDRELIVLTVLPGGAAEVAGIKPQDVIVKAGDVSLEGMAHAVAVAAIQKELSTTQTFTLRRGPKEPVKVAVTGATPAIKETSVDAASAGVAPAFDEKLFEPLSTQGPGGFGIRLPQLVELIAERGTNGVARLYQRFGGIEGLAAKLNCSVEQGIAGDEEDLENRKNVFGRNETPDVKPKTLLELMWEAMQDLTLIILLFAAILSIILNLTVEKNYTTGWIEGVAILVSVCIVVMVTAVNDLQKERQFQELKASQASSQTVTVVRGGQDVDVPFAEVVVGDLIEVKGGLILPADGVIVRCSDVFCDESALTGEPHDIKKDTMQNPWMLSGTSVKQGTGRMIVTCVGLFSEEGIIQKLITRVGEDESRRLEELAKEGMSASEAPMQNPEDIADEIDARQAVNFDKLTEDEQNAVLKTEEKKEKKGKQESILQAKLEMMAIQIGYGATFFAVLTFVVLVLYHSISVFGVDGHKYSDIVNATHTDDDDGAAEVITYGKDFWLSLTGYFIIAITVLVVAIPEGLPLAVTISLAYSVKKMMTDHNLVRVLAACETMGNATTICSDKTGTLTKNRMTVVKSWMFGKEYAAGDELEADASLVHDFAQAVALNSDGGSTYEIDPETNLPNQKQNKTECACLLYADNISTKHHTKHRQEIPRPYVKEYPFNSAKKRMQCVVQLPSGGYRVYVKGASEIILDLATDYLDNSGQRVALTPEIKEDIEKNVIVKFAEQALRVICLAYVDYDTAQDWDNEEVTLENLAIQGFVGIQDPVRDEVPDAVATCQRAGVVVRMLTGDNMITARAIAINCGIITPDDDYLVLEGPDFRRRVVNEDGSINYDEMNQIWPRLRVMGRCSPSDKYNLVRGLIKAGQVVAVTGDGTNDGPALSAADVGFSMGITGTDVAKEASDIIITDDNFTSIVKAILWGRNVYDSISKFLVFQLTVNVVAVLVSFIGACAFRQSPLRAVQLLWVNLIMDTFAALALATEPPTPDLLDRAPYGRDKALLSRVMLRQVLGHSVYQMAIVNLLVFYGATMFNLDVDGTDNISHSSPPTVHFTMVFNSFVWMQIFNELNARIINDDLTITTKKGKKIGGLIGAFARPWYGIFSNWIFVMVLVGTAICQVIIVQFGGLALHVVPLTAAQYGYCIALGAGSLPWNVMLHYLFPWRWIPESWEPGKYAELTPDRAADIDEEDETEKKIVELPQGGLDAPVPEEEVRERVNSVRGERPNVSVDAQEEETGRSGSVLWRAVSRRLRFQMRVASAFRTAGRLARLRRRTSGNPNRALGGPRARTARRVSESHLEPALNENPARAMWHSVVARLRFQLRVVNAFRAGVTGPQQALLDGETVDVDAVDAAAAPQEQPAPLTLADVGRSSSTV
eukprot:m.37606 g.37606  ORF g.37606 m.37606 type:complete len:1393 (+) comp10114_c1_seq1:14-4192(+)